MARNRIIYQSEALFVGPSPATGFLFTVNGSGAPSDNLAEVRTYFGNPSISAGQITNRLTQIHRAQTFNYGINVSRQDINQGGMLAAIGREIIEAPTVSADLSYYVTNVNNEQALGLTVNAGVSALSGLLSKAEDEKDYFVLITPEGSDAANNTSTVGKQCIAIGNGFLSSYSVEGAVGGIPTATVRVEALNVDHWLGHSGLQTPAINPMNGTKITGKYFTVPTATSGLAGQVVALRPGDMTVDVGLAGLGVSDVNANIQSFTLSFDLARDPIQALGNRFAKSREIRFPVSANMSIEANLSDFKSGSLADILCNDQSYDISVTMRKPTCDASLGAVAMQYTLKGAKFDSQNVTTSIGPNARVTMQLSAQLGGPEDVTKGLFISGIVN